MHPYTGFIALGVLASAGCAGNQVRQSCTYLPPAGVSDSYDRFRNETAVRLDRLSFGSPIPLAGTTLCFFPTSLLLDGVFSGRERGPTPTIRLTLITLSPVGAAPDVILC